MNLVIEPVTSGDQAESSLNEKRSSGTLSNQPLRRHRPFNETNCQQTSTWYHFHS